ncbi:hypothetical protein TREMEDRAFT_61307 [Tremella mesenterica DSM 1558]|uniref:uncharacterized protein n=1 Tax=Tremella mesenterica (strain ATCC 24925 / CBS 8224 / DSM 1558 / NBRC 9311 / NRRL Y-6157 / RJB 2259-6 / UBC 559-6) TaxID=578456 RepID=UPI0003F49A11|nr:uncharacterized protein TREMEDRAFT_61307 [Tremella mesenterica DSM 1558]EIW70800.1 hypothetical protein TREMEDRAFT_61307 [Tremella mesenterica DSM 1558]
MSSPLKENQHSASQPLSWRARPGSLCAVSPVGLIVEPIQGFMYRGGRITDHGSDELWRENFRAFNNSFSKKFSPNPEIVEAGGKDMPDKLFTELEARSLSSCGNVTTRRPTSICVFTDEEYHGEFVLNLTTVCRPGAKPQGTTLLTGRTIGATTSDALEDEASTIQEL